uniref:Uncharacterized protein LOC114339678 n=1 Tax=Diabrotica virgifera virgifera TaxID=50390 RepID=A0A6P7GJL2_DIAVI
MDLNCQACHKITIPTDCSKLECSACKTTWHGVCTQPQPLKFSPATLLIWKCQNCTTEADASTMHFNAIMAQLANLSNAIATCNTRMSDLHNLVNSQSTKIDACISEIAVLRRENEQLKIKIQKIESSPPENILIELADRKQREKNVLLMAVPENTESDEVNAQQILNQYTFWNSQGFANLDKFVRDYDDCSVLCLTETWLLNECNNLSIVLSSYNVISSPASKEKSVGRASGGIYIFYKNVYNCVILEKTPWWLFYRLVSPSEESIIICTVYFKPSLDIVYILELFQVSLSEILENHFDVPLLIGGDFNSRISDIGEVPPEMLEGTNLSEYRLSNDMVLNTKGRHIIDFMNTNSFCLLNGRTESDTPAQFTHISKAGNSVIDLAFIQNSAIPIIQDLCVMNHNSPSDHFGILVTCVSDCFRESRFKKALPIQKKTIYQWNTDLAFF